MIPLRDDIPCRRTPVVNYLVIAACSLVFWAQLNTGRDQPSLSEQYGMIPARVENPEAEIERTVGVERIATPEGLVLRPITRPAAPSPVPPLLTLLTCIFLHGGWLHFLGNMWFLYIFGDNVEDRFGHLGFALFYLFCGGAASAAHWLSDPSSTVPTIGASGAIAGVMGAYFVSYPKARVQAIIPIFIILYVAVVPAALFLGVWFVIQLISGAMATAEGGGVAWWAHIGGFLVGAVIVMVLDALRLLPSPNRPSEFNRSGRYRYRTGE